MEEKEEKKTKNVSELEERIKELEKQISQLKNDNKELKNESERHKRMALYMEGRHKDLWDERRIMMQDILQMKQQLNDYSIANEELLETNFKLSQKLTEITAQNNNNANLFKDNSTQTDFADIDNNKPETQTEHKNKSCEK